MKHFIDIDQASGGELRHVLDVGRSLRAEREKGRANPPVLAGQTLAMYFEKPSLRTRVSFQQAMYELGGHAMVLTQEEVGLGVRESIADATRVLCGMIQGIMARVYEHDKLVEMSQHATVPVINALSDVSHPCQTLADWMTIEDEFGVDLAGRCVVFVGDGNNVARSLAEMCGKVGAQFILAAPEGYQLDEATLEKVRRNNPQAELHQTTDAQAAVEHADAIYCDTFVSMGQESEKARRLKVFADYQVNEALLQRAPKHAIVLHCLPAYRGVEITDAVMDGPQSRVFEQAHNRLHAQKGLLAVLMGGA